MNFHMKEYEVTLPTAWGSGEIIYVASRGQRQGRRMAWEQPGSSLGFRWVVQDEQLTIIARMAA